jgi:hypothetical protein
MRPYHSGGDSGGKEISFCLNSTISVRWGPQSGAVTVKVKCYLQRWSGGGVKLIQLPSI